MDETITATLKQWFPVGGRIHGKIYGDVRKRFEDGTPVTTSAINADASDIDGGRLVTRNSVYNLEDRYQAPEAKATF